MKKIIINLVALLGILFATIFFLVSCGLTKEKVDTQKRFYLTGEQIKWEPNHTIKSVHDGDTFEDESRNVYRLFSVDTPEITQYGSNKSSQATEGLEYIWAQNATYFAKKALLNKRVQIAMKQYDVYKRKVAAVFYKDEQGNTKNLAMELVKHGLARVAFISKTNKQFKVRGSFFDYMKIMEDNAKLNKIGVFAYPSDEYRDIFPKTRIGI